MAGGRSGFDEEELRFAQLLARGAPENVEDLLEVGRRVLTDSTHIDPGHDADEAARLLLAAAYRSHPSPTEIPSPRARERYLSYVARRASGEPVAFITGSTEFCGLELRIRPGLFVPRPSSRFLVESAAAKIRAVPSPTAVDLCTGSGAIALGLAATAAHAEVWGVDIAPLAVRQAAANARRLRLRARFRRGDLYGGLPRVLRHRVDVITGYIPYLTPDDVANMYTEIREYEPLFTLLDLGNDHLSLLRRAATEAPEWLGPGGWLLIEVDPDTAPAVGGLLTDVGLVDVDVRGDDSSWDVIVAGRRPRAP